MNNNIESLREEINLINLEQIKNLVENFLAEVVPEYFFKVPASSSGKYHPSFDQGESGLVRHTKMTVEVVKELMNLDMFMQDIGNYSQNRDIIIASCILHDTFKNGYTDSGTTVTSHPSIAADEFYNFCNKKTSAEEKIVVKQISDAIRWHMGQWYNDTVMEHKSLRAQLVHLADYIASRKFFDKFDKKLEKDGAVFEVYDHTFNMVIAMSDFTDEEIKTLEERLRSRFEWGLIGDINSPDYETRVAILQKKAQIEGIEISDEILKYIAEKITSNIRELEGVFNKVLAYRGLVNKEITMEVAYEALKYYEEHSGVKIITPEMVVESCSKFYNIKKEDIMGTRKTKEIARARQVSMYLMREIIGIAQLKIAKFFGKDHTTVSYAIEKIEKEIADNTSFHMEIESLKDDIKN